MPLLDAIVVALISSSFVRSMHDDDDDADVDDDGDAVRSTAPPLVHTGDICDGQWISPPPVVVGCNTSGKHWMVTSLDRIQPAVRLQRVSITITMIITDVDEHPISTPIIIVLIYIVLIDQIKLARAIFKYNNNFNISL